MNTKQLECFVEVAETLNFSVAAQKLYITQPTVSHQIQSLEEELNVQLFERNKKHVKLTLAGQVFYNDAKEILTRENVAKSRVKVTDNRYSTKIAIAFSAIEMEQKKLPAFIARFTQEHPEVFLYFHQFPPKTGIQNLVDDKMDVLLYHTADVFLTKDIESKTILQDSFVCLVPNHSKLSQKTCLTPTDLEDECLIFPEDTVRTKEEKELIAYLQAQVSHLKIYYCDTKEVATMLVESGIGVAIMPSFCVKERSKVTQIALELPEPLSNVPYGLAWKHQSKPLSTFIEEFTAYVTGE